MSRQEKYNHRDLTYSIWHRNRPEDWLTVIDADWVEYYNGSMKEPLAVIEEAKDVGQNKSTIVTANLARRANLPAYRLLWTQGKSLGSIMCPKCDGTGRVTIYDIESFRARLMWPPGGSEKILTPEQWHDFLKKLRKKHEYVDGFFKLDRYDK